MVRLERIDEDIIKEIKYLLKEEDSVSYEVAKIRKSFIGQINNEIAPALPDVYGKNGVNLFKTSVNNNILNNSINIHYTILQAKDKSCLLKGLTEDSFKNINSFNIDSNTLEESLNLFICFIGKSLYFEGCNFSHEIEHAYQHFCKKNSIKDYNPTIKDKTNYNKFFDLMNSSDNIEKYIGIIGYLSTYSEQDAFIQGLVEELDGVTDSNVYIKYEKSETRIILNNYQQSIQLLLKKYNDKGLKEKIDNVCFSCGMTFNSFIKNGQVGLKRFEGKIGKVLKHFFESNKTIFEKIDE